jgi:hypothetical protein
MFMILPMSENWELILKYIIFPRMPRLAMAITPIAMPSMARMVLI